ncbi:MAG: hypothetical protein QM582_17190 [Micropruina sp.]|uniref:hypothetical protein n=1 Tax=Micropruina sp. TaxID=2737536 RepID=UPI0039E287B6
MRRLAVRAAAALATVAVLAAGAFWFREVFTEYRSDSANWSASVTTIEVDAAAGVQVAVERIDGGGDQSASDVQWQTHSILGRAEVTDTESGRLSARCHTPTPLSRCAIWLTVRTTTPRTRVVIVQHPGATIADTDRRVPVEIRQAP